VVGNLCFDACFSQLEPKPPSGGQTKKHKNQYTTQALPE
jgi:hypothetical protein